jgi:hypothetical protein
MAAAIKKTPAEKIAEYKAKIKQLEAKQAEQKLDVSSPGMNQLLAAIEVVTRDNKCSVFDVLKSVSRIKRTGAKIEPPTKKKREVKTPSSAQSVTDDAAPKRQGPTSKTKQGPKK